MAESEIQIIGLFPIPVAVFKLEKNHKKTYDWLKKKPMRATSAAGPEQHLVTEDSFILENRECADLRREMERNISRFMQEILSFKSTGRITQSWVNQNRPGDGTHQHIHPNSLVSSVLYFDMPGDTTTIRFHKDTADPATKFIMRPDLDRDKITERYFSWDWHEISVERDQMICFPSYLSHSVTQNTLDGDRWTLAVNSITVDGLGTERELTRLVI
jgi:uncharacterized protein (TIGR02466 family)